MLSKSLSGIAGQPEPLVQVARIAPLHGLNPLAKEVRIAAARLIAAWMDYTRLDFPGAAPELADPLAAEVRVANSLSGTRRIATLLGLLSPGLGEDAAVVSLIEDLCGTLQGQAVSG